MQAVYIPKNAETGKSCEFPQVCQIATHQACVRLSKYLSHFESLKTVVSSPCARAYCHHRRRRRGWNQETNTSTSSSALAVRTGFLVAAIIRRFFQGAWASRVTASAGEGHSQADAFNG